MAWDEWEHIKAGAAAGPSTSTRLNQLAPSAGGGGVGKPDLATSPAAKKAPTAGGHPGRRVPG
ncbi:hypothetical protein ACFWWS_32150 [Streptomyces sp. NPDC059083]|uniref:hypothetical protein n=2 Tax=Streptomyces TaxID=1883 RepID=UPI003677B00E